jgi:cytochrome bd-type quinol oxidase subunit 1
MNRWVLVLSTYIAVGLAICGIYFFSTGVWLILDGDLDAQTKAFVYMLMVAGGLGILAASLCTWVMWRFFRSIRRDVH